FCLSPAQTGSDEHNTANPRQGPHLAHQEGWLNSLKMTAIMGTGLMAGGRIVPMAFPMASFLRVMLERGMVRLTYRTIPLSSGPLLPRHRKVEQMFRLDEMVVAVGAEVDAHPLHGAGQGVVAGRVVLRHRRAGLAANVRRL